MQKLFRYSTTIIVLVLSLVGLIDVLKVFGNRPPTAPAPFVVPDPRLNNEFTMPQPLLDRFGLNANVIHSTALSPSSLTNSVRITDDMETISMRVPIDWEEIEWGTWTIGGQEVGIYLAAAPDLGSYLTTGTGPGVFFGVSNILANNHRVSNPAMVVNPAILQLLNYEKDQRSNRCRTGGRFQTRSNYFQGEYDLYLDCTQQQIGELVSVTMPAHQSYLTLVRVSMVTAADVSAAMQILESYQVLIPGLDDEHHHDGDEPHQH